VEERRPTILASNILYLIAVVCLIGLSVVMAYVFPVNEENFNAYFYIQAFVTEFGVIFLPALIYLLARKMPIREVVRLNPLKWSQFLIVVSLALTGYVVIIFFNYIWIWILSSLGGKVSAPPIPVAENGLDLLVNILVIAGTAAFAEEFLFRGVILRGYERFGHKKAIVFSGILFGILHMQTQSFFATIFLGILIGYLVYKTNSILAGMTYHFLNNSIAVLLSFASNAVLKMSEGMGNVAPATLDQMPKEVMIMTFGVLGFLGVGALGIFIGLLIALNYVSRKEDSRREAAEALAKPAAPVKLWHYTPLVFGVSMVIYMIINDILYMFR